MKHYYNAHVMQCMKFKDHLKNLKNLKKKKKKKKAHPKILTKTQKF